MRYTVFIHVNDWEPFWKVYCSEEFNIWESVYKSYTWWVLLIWEYNALWSTFLILGSEITFLHHSSDLILYQRIKLWWLTCRNVRWLSGLPTSLIQFWEMDLMPKGSLAVNGQTKCLLKLLIYMPRHISLTKQIMI